MFEIFKEFKIISQGEVELPFAQRFIAYLADNAPGVAEVKEIRKDKLNGIWVFIDVYVSQPTAPAYDLHNLEPLVVHFQEQSRPPGVYSCREDFPDTPHQNFVLDGMPYSLCIDSRSWAEASLTYTPAELLHRIVLWLERAGKGELHGVDQPLDPVFVSSSLTIVLSEDVFRSSPEEHKDYCGIMLGGSKTILGIIEIDKSKPPPKKYSNFKNTFLIFNAPPSTMTRLREAPSNLARLHASMLERGIDVVNEIANSIQDRINDNNDWKRLWLDSHLTLLIRLPITAQGSIFSSMTQTLAFTTEKKVGEIGETLGLLIKNRAENAQNIPYTQRIPWGDPDTSNISNIELIVSDVNPVFDSSLAAMMAGRQAADHRKAVMIGAGSVGSLVANTLAREGLFEFTIVDNDVFLPHNIARHALLSFKVGAPKAESLAEHISHICSDSTPRFINTNVLEPDDDKRKELDTAFQEADLILDASASVPVSRHLSDLPSPGRRSSFYYVPDGKTAILMVEDSERNIDLRCLEATVYAQVLRNNDLADLFSGQVGVMQYSGRCGDITTKMAASQAQILSGLISYSIGDTLSKSESHLQVWRLSNDGSVSTLILPTSQFIAYAMDDWTIRVLPELVGEIMALRTEKLPCETGGALLGIVDIPRKQIEVISALPAPPDSVERPVEFRRGILGLQKNVERSMLLTLNQIRYVGEWHSHPRGCSPTPSTIDIADLLTMSQALSMDGCPGVQLIAGDDSLGVVLGMIGDGK